MKHIAVLILSFWTCLTHGQTYTWMNEYETNSFSNSINLIDFTIDAGKNIVVVGSYDGTVDMDPGIGSDIYTGPSTSLIVHKVDENGNLLWNRAVQGNGFLGVSGKKVKLDQSGNIYVAGFFDGNADFNTGSGVLNFSCNNLQDGFILKLSPTGSFIWAKQFRIGRAGELTDFEVNAQTGACIITTPFQQWIDVDPSSNNLIINEHPTISNNNNTDNSVAIMLDQNGNFQWHYFIGAEDGENINNPTFYNNQIVLDLSISTSDSVDVDPSGAIYKMKSIPGVFTGQRIKVFLDNSGIFVTGKHLYLHPSNTQIGFQEIIDQNGNIWISGYFENTVDIDFGTGVNNLTAFSGKDAFVAKYDSQYNLLDHYVLYGNGFTYLWLTDVDQLGVGYMYGNAQFSTDIDPDPSQSYFTNSFFYIKMGMENFELIQVNDSDADIYATSGKLHLPTRELIISAGAFTNGTTVDVDPSSAVVNHSKVGNGYSRLLVKWAYCQNQTFSTTNVSTCESTYTSPSRKFTWSSTGTYQDTIYNHEGCDSIMTINLVLDGKTYSSFSGYGCNSYTAPSGEVYTSNGVYNDTIPNSLGCDSVMTITVSLGEILTEQFPTICDGETFTLPNGSIHSSSGNYNDTLMSSNGCDSVITFHLTVNLTYHENLTIEACQSYTLPDGQLVTQDGIYQVALQTMQGCDSTFTIDVTFGEITHTELVEECFEYSLPNGTVVQTSGFYDVTLLSSEGCDSIVTYNVTINSFQIDTVNTYPNIVLSVLPSGGSYQWLNCNDYSLIPNETSQTFTASVNGSYAVEVTLNGCTDTSDCMTVSTVGIEELNLPFVKIFPNPTTDGVTIEFPISTFEKVTILDISGRKVVDQEIKYLSTHAQINLKGFTKGVYLINLTSKENSYVRRIVLE
jgi:hypothetical protein